MNQKLQVLCVGSASKDIFFPTTEAVVLETPEDITAQTKVAFELGGKFLVRDRYEAPGGVAANVSLGLARLGIRTGCYSKVGRDETGHFIKQELARGQVAVSALEEDARVKSDLSAIIVIAQTGDRIIFHNRDANERLSIDETRVPETDWLYVSALNGPWQDNFSRLMEIRRNRNLRLALNPGQHNLKKDPRRILDALSETSALFLNKDEAIELLLTAKVTENKDLLNDECFLLQTLFDRGVPIIGLTDGKRGAWGYDGKDFLHADIFEPRGVVDTTGAGDAFGSGFFAAHLWKLPLASSLRYGVANAGSVVGSFGAVQGLLSQEEIGGFLPSIKLTALTPKHPRETRKMV